MRYNRLQKTLGYFLLTLILIGSYAISRHHYLLFHSFAELFSIIISSCIFILAWVSKEKSKNYAFIFLGIAYLFVGGIDLFHTLSYKGMNIFPGDIFYANQLWIAARFLESLSLLIFSLSINKNFKVNYYLTFLLYFLITTALLLSIFYFKNFPLCFIEGIGQTKFKITSEYLICLILIISFIILFKKRNHFEKKILFYIFLSLISTIVSEFLFTLYVDNYGITNVLGHIFKIISFYMIYKSIIVINIEEPFSFIFSQLTNKIEEISSLNLELERINRTKNKFFSIISHDLVNPIGGLKNLLFLIHSGWEKFSEEQKKEYVQLLLQSSVHISDLLNNLLLWSKQQMNKLEITKSKFLLNNLIQKNIDLFTHSAKIKNISFITQFSGDTYLNADENMLNSVIRNLLNNAVKFSYPNGKIIIGILETKNTIQISVADNGIGIKKNEQEKLFRIDSSFLRKGTNDESGNGLGLIICKEFIEKNKGKLWVESEEGKGSTFFIEFKKPCQT